MGRPRLSQGCFGSQPASTRSSCTEGGGSGQFGSQAGTARAQFSWFGPRSFHACDGTMHIAVRSPPWVCGCLPPDK